MASLAWSQGQGARNTGETGIGGGTLTAVTTPVNEIHAWPQTLRGGRSILYTSIPVGDAAALMVLDTSTGQSKQVQSGAGGRYLPSGMYLYRLHVADAQTGAVRAPLEGRLVVVK